MENRLFAFKGNAFWTKPLVIFILLLILLIPLGFISNLVQDRAGVKEAAEQSIMSPIGGELKIGGIVLSIPYKRNIEVVDKNGLTTMIETKEQIFITPQNYALSTELNPQFLKRGIFSVPVFNGDVALKAKFAALNLQSLDINEKDLLIDEAVLILSVANKKSFTAFPTLKIADKELEQSLINPKYSPFRQSIYYKLPSQSAISGFEINGTLGVQGGVRTSLLPIGQNNVFSVKSPWNTPSFGGGWLPKNRSVSKDGFEAKWEISGLSTSFYHIWKSSDNIRYDTIDNRESVDIIFISPINNYSLALRCVTYAILFLAVPFLAIFLCEIYSGSRIHMIQYLLIGAADVLFYLLILSISEHLSFLLSYLIASIAVCGTILFYGAAIFRASKWGVFIALVHAVSYCILYGILQSEDYALLMGSVMIFAVIVLVMYLTRKIDWYESKINF